MRFQTPLIRARLIRRYKRFLADCVLEDGREVTVHCPNPGAMTGLAEPGATIWLEKARAGAKLPFGWRLVDLAEGGLAAVDTGLANRAVRRALEARAIAPFARYTTVRPEAPFGTNGRVDFLLCAPGLPDVYVEVKSVTLSRQAGLAEFPDTTTARGARHLADLSAEAARGARAALLYLVQRTDCTQVAVAADIDPAYAAAQKAARAAGVETLAFAADITVDGIAVAAPLPIL